MNAGWSVPDDGQACLLLSSPRAIKLALKQLGYRDVYDTDDFGRKPLPALDYGIEEK